MNYINEYYKSQKELTVEEKQIKHNLENKEIAQKIIQFKKDFDLYQTEIQKLNRESKTRLYDERIDLFGSTEFNHGHYGEYKLNYHTLSLVDQQEATKTLKYKNVHDTYGEDIRTIEDTEVEILNKSHYHTYGRIIRTGEEISIINDSVEYHKEIHYIYDLINQKYLNKKIFSNGKFKDIRYDQFHEYHLKLDNVESTSYGQTSLIPLFKNIEKGELIVVLANINKTKYAINTDIYTNNFYRINLITGVSKRIFDGIDKTNRELDHYDLSDFVNIYISRYLEELYSLEPNTLPDDINLSQYLVLLKYTNNLFQSFLQVGTKTPWFISNLTKTIRSAGKPIQDKNIQTWLDISLPDFKYLTEQPNQDMLIHYMVANKYKPVSLQEFLKTENKIIELNNKWLKEFDQRKSVTSANVHENVIFRNKRNKFLFSSSTLPQFMVTYVNKGIYRNHSLYRYLKYIIDEGKRSYNKENGTYLTLKDIESDLIDYNQMLKEINPKSKFMLPYKIKNAHDTMILNYNDIMAERRAMEGDYDWGNTTFSKRYSKADHTRYTDERYMMQAPNSMLDLHEEGSSLNHCVGGYGNRIKSGDCLIYFLREKRQPKKSLVTVEIKKIGETYYVNQSKGQGNRLENTSEREFIRNWLNDYQNSYLERKEELEKEARERIARIKESQMKEDKYSIHIVEALKLCGYNQATYNESITKIENYESAIQEGLIKCTVDMLIEDAYNDDTLDSAIDLIKQALKKEGYKQKDITILSKQEIIEKARIYSLDQQTYEIQEER